jgi:uncharacterized protein (DUF2141 family)
MTPTSADGWHAAFLLVSRSMKAVVSCLAPMRGFVLTAPAAAQGPACTGRESPYRLYVEVQDVRSSEGLMAVTLYADDRRKFLAHHGSLYVGRVPATKGTTTVCIHVPSPGVYALAVYHDVNANRRYDRTAVGLPAEPFGFSNNPRVFLGMPAWSAVRLAVPKTDMRTTVKLHNP